MSIQLLHISLYPTEGTDIARIEKVMNTGLDWLRYAPNCWLVRTTSDASTWCRRLQPFVTPGKPGTQLLVCRVDLSERQGWLTPKVWEWIRRYTEESRKAVRMSGKPTPQKKSPIPKQTFPPKRTK